MNTVNQRNCRIFVSNLSYSINDEELFESFKDFGNVSDCVIIRDNYARSRGFGFIEYAKTEEADNAVKKMHGQLLKGRKLVALIAKERKR